MRVLIADDEKLVADTLALIFQSRQIEAVAVYSGEDAVQTAMTFNPDVVVCDVVMGKMNGFEVGAYLSEHLPSCNVVLFSGQASATDIQARAGDNARRFDVLAKPVHPRVLIDYVEACGRTGPLSIG